MIFCVCCIFTVYVFTVLLPVGVIKDKKRIIIAASMHRGITLACISADADMYGVPGRFVCFHMDLDRSSRFCSDHRS